MHCLRVYLKFSSPAAVPESVLELEFAEDILDVTFIHDHKMKFPVSIVTSVEQIMKNSDKESVP